MTASVSVLVTLVFGVLFLDVASIRSSAMGRCLVSLAVGLVMLAMMGLLLASMCC